MKLGKYVTNIGVLSTLMGALGVSKQTKKMPHDWRRLLVWAGWLIGLVLTVASVAMDPNENEKQN